MKIVIDLTTGQAVSDSAEITIEQAQKIDVLYSGLMNKLLIKKSTILSDNAKLIPFEQ